MRNVIITIFIFISNIALAIQNKTINWPFEGIFGYLDIISARRGFEVYKNVCSNCHSLNHVSYIDLQAIGVSKDEIKSLAETHTIEDIDDDGNLIERSKLVTEKIAGIYKNNNAARFANNGLLPPDLSLITKARHDGPNYVYSVLTGYYEKPQNFLIEDGLYFNLYFPNHKIGMPPPLVDNGVLYQDGTIASIEQMAQDVIIFLQWCAEPEMEARKRLGAKVIIFLSIFGIIAFVRKRQIWNQIK